MTAFARPVSRKMTAQAVAVARPDAALLINSVVILTVILVLLAGAAWTLVT